MSSHSEEIRVENVVASTGINQELDLESLSTDLPSNASYDPDEFPGLIYRTQDPKTSMLVFRSGKIVTTGAQSKAEVREAVDQFLIECSELGIEVPDRPEITVQNLVSSANLGETLNLNAITIGLGLENVEYEPEQFPGLVYRLDEPSVVVLLFGSGKLVITGATSAEDASHAFSTVRSELADLDLLG